MSVTAAFTNTGSSTWTAGTYQLSAVPVGTTTWGPTTVSLGASVAPGSNAAFTFTVTAPSNSGTYTFAWQMANGSTLFGAQTAQSVAVRCALGDLFAGSSQLVDDPTFSPPAELFQNGPTPGHSDTSTVDTGAVGSPERYRMYFRTFKNTANALIQYGIPTGIGLATSADGATWTPYQSGLPVLAERPSASTTGCTPDPGNCVITPYAPSVVREANGSFTMAYEVMDTSVPGGATTPRNWIEASTSADGYTWTPLTNRSGSIAKVLTASVAWEGLDATGHNVGNVGTPDLQRTASGYNVSYHGWGGTNFSRGTASGSSLLKLSRAASNPQFVSAPGWEGTGPGKGADTTEGGFTYRIFEAFNGGPGCVQTNVEVGWGLARSADGGSTWTYSAMNPIRTDRVGWSCGEDMPAWQVVNGTPTVLTTRLNAVPSGKSNLRRYAISRPAPSQTTESRTIGVCVADTGTGYWQVDASGIISAFGGATAIPSPAGASYVAAAPRPQGDGMWLLTAAGTVVNAGAAPTVPVITLASGTTPVGIDSDSTGNGGWVATSDGSVVPFGDASVPTLTGGIRTASTVALTRSAGSSTNGFWVLNASGAIASYNGAPVLTGPASMTAAAVGFSTRADGAGGWIVDTGGRIYPVGTGTPAIGDTTPPDHTSAGYQPLGHFAVVGISRRSVGADTGYYLVAGDGGVIDFGTASYAGHVRAPGFNS
ncbi:MAG: hypothetical protein NVS3B12_31950 [Acidimicrobiales bacterium]